MVSETRIERVDPEVHAGLDLAVRFVHAEIDALRALGVPVGEDDYRGLHIPEREVERLLGTPRHPQGHRPRPVAVQALQAELSSLIASSKGRLRRLTDLASLSPFDVGCLLVCLASEVDPGVERLLAYAQDDVTRRRPRADLLFRIFGSDGHGERDAFLPGAPLLRHRLVQLFDEPGQPLTPLSLRQLALDPRIAEYLLGSDAFCDPLADFARILPRNEGPVAMLLQELCAALVALASSEPESRPRSIALTGPDPVLLRAAATTLGTSLGRPVLAIEVATLAQEAGLETAVVLSLREAALQDAILYLEGAEALEQADRARLGTMLAGQSSAAVAVVGLDERTNWNGFTIEIGELDYGRRRSLWEVSLRDQAPALEAEVDAIAAKFRLGGEDIQRAGQLALLTARWRDPVRGTLDPADLYAAARSQSTPILSGLARKVTPHYHWEDLVLPDDALEQLHEISAQVEHRHRVYTAWGFERKLALSRGVMALLAGNSGTGKTMAADVMANALGLDLYRIDLSSVVSKYIGETEKNLDAIFREAERSNAILFFDEADALFGKRSEVKDAHDRYANIETAYLLQRMEEYTGIVILATNLKMNLDEAFIRRLHFVVDFPMPDEPYRKRIWEGAVPAEAPVAGDVDWAFLARQFKVSGGNIKNAVVAGAFLAAADGGSIGMSHFIRGMRREYQKLGRMVTEAEFGQYIALLQAQAPIPPAGGV